jgi:hypothetical protein
MKIYTYVSAPISLHNCASPDLSGRKFPAMVKLENIDDPTKIHKLITPSRHKVYKEPH